MQKLRVGEVRPKRENKKPNFLSRLAAGLLLVGTAVHADEEIKKPEEKKPPIVLPVSSLSTGGAYIRSYGIDAYAKLNVRWAEGNEDSKLGCETPCHDLKLYNVMLTSNLQWLGIDWLNIRLGYYTLSNNGEFRARDAYQDSNLDEQRTVAGLGFLPINSDGNLLYLEAAATIPTSSERYARTAVADDLNTTTTIANAGRNEPGVTWRFMLNLGNVHAFHEGSTDMLMPMVALVDIDMPWRALPWTHKEIPPALHLRAYTYEREQDQPQRLDKYNRFLAGQAAVDYPFLTSARGYGLAVYTGVGLDDINGRGVLSAPLGIALRSYIGSMTATIDPLSTSLGLIISLVIPSELFNGLFFGAEDSGLLFMPRNYVRTDMDMFAGWR